MIIHKMDCILNKNIIRLIVCLQFVVAVFCDANFELKLISFSNPSGKESDGDCCESILGGTCSSNFQCDPEIYICIGSSSCYNTGEYTNQNSFNFGSSLNSGVKNPYIKYLPTWSGSISVSMDVKDKDDNDHDPMGYKSRTYQQTTADPKESSSAWKDFTFTWSFSSHTMSVNAKARVYCKQYYYGADCGILCFPRDTDEHGHYTCSEDGTKVCRKNYYGDSCTVRCVPEDSDSGHYFCGENGEKICLNGWTGANCTEDVDECATESPCSPNGNCTNLNGSYTCECKAAYTGVNCEEVKLFCDENPCSNNSVCNNTFGGYECICVDFWRGRHCDEEPYCNSNPCSNNSTCNNTDGGYFCVCNEGWQGQNCTEEVTPCTSGPCLNGGLCSVAGSTYNCTCVGEWEGTECQSEIIEVFSDNRSITLAGELTPQLENNLTENIDDLMIDMGFPNTTINIESNYNDSNNKSTIDITVSSHDPNIVGALQGVPLDVLKEYLPLPLPSTMPESQPTAQPIAGFKSAAWVKRHWYVILVIVLALIAVIAVLVIVLFVVKKRRTEKKQKSGFDNDQPVQPINGAISDAAIGFDNNLYYEIRHPDTVEGLPNGKY